MLLFLTFSSSSSTTTFGQWALLFVFHWEGDLFIFFFFFRELVSKEGKRKEWEKERTKERKERKKERESERERKRAEWLFFFLFTRSFALRVRFELCRRPSRSGSYWCLNGTKYDIAAASSWSDCCCLSTKAGQMVGWLVAWSVAEECQRFIGASALTLPSYLRPYYAWKVLLRNGWVSLMMPSHFYVRSSSSIVSIDTAALLKEGTAKQPTEWGTWSMIFAVRLVRKIIYVSLFFSLFLSHFLSYSFSLALSLFL